MNNEMTHNIFNKYQVLLKHSSFIKLCKDLSFKLNGILGQNLNEVESVKQWIEVFNKTQRLSIPGYEVNSNSVFIHGYNHSEKGSHPSGVEFDYTRNLTQKRELADIIFIASFYENNRKVMEKITFNQAKWGSIKKTTSSWNIDKEQLFLVANFPRFSGVNGSLIPNKDFNIQDFSANLGSYGLMTPENFIYLSAKYLQQLIAGKKSINLNDFKCIPPISTYRHYNDFYRYALFSISNPFCNSTYDFITDFLSGRIGEIIIDSYSGNDNARDLFHSLLSAISTLDSSKISNVDFSEFLNNYGDFNRSENFINTEKQFSESLGIVQMNIKIDE